jgi:DNA-binding NarL/FixJ family response regulator
VAIVNNVLQRRAPKNSPEAALDIADLASQIAEIKSMLTKRNLLGQSTTPIKIDLTPREQSVLELVSKGLMNKEIARQLNTSVRNIEKYVSRLFSKTGTNSRTELVRFALENGLTS